MQASLLVMCLLWKARQARLRIDDFGNKIGPDVPIVTVTNSDPDSLEQEVEDFESGEQTPLLRQGGDTRPKGDKRSFFAWIFRR